MTYVIRIDVNFLKFPAGNSKVAQFSLHQRKLRWHAFWPFDLLPWCTVSFFTSFLWWVFYPYAETRAAQAWFGSPYHTSITKALALEPAVSLYFLLLQSSNLFWFELFIHILQTIKYNRKYNLQETQHFLLLKQSGGPGVMMVYSFCFILAAMGWWCNHFTLYIYCFLPQYYGNLKMASSWIFIENIFNMLIINMTLELFCFYIVSLLSWHNYQGAT